MPCCGHRIEGLLGVKIVVVVVIGAQGTYTVTLNMENM